MTPDPGFAGDPPLHILERHRDFDRGYDRGRDRDSTRRHGRSDDLGHGRDYSQGRDKDYGRRDGRRPRQSSRSQERPRGGRGFDGRGSPSPPTPRRDKRKGRNLDRYVSAKRDSRRRPRRSRSPRGKRHASSRRVRSPLQDRITSRRTPSGEHELLSKVEDAGYVSDKHQESDLEMPDQGHEPSEQFLEEDTSPPPNRSIFGQSTLSGILSYSDNLRAEDRDVIMTDSADMIYGDLGPAWEVFNLPREEFVLALDELITDVARTLLPDHKMGGELVTVYAEEPELADALQATEEVQPAVKLTTASLDLLMKTTAPPGISGDTGLGKFSELSLHESAMPERQKTPAIEVGIAVKHDDPKSPYSQKVVDLMKKANRQNVWVNKIQRNRAHDFLTFASGVHACTGLSVAKLPEPDWQETGSELGANIGADENMKIEDPAQYELEDIVMTDEGTVQVVKPDTPGSNGAPIKTEDTTVVEYGDTISLSIEDLEVVGKDSYVSAGTGESSMTEVGDQVMGEAASFAQTPAED